MNSDVAVIKEGYMPDGRTYRAVLMFCRRNGLKFPGKRTLKNSEEINKKFNQTKEIQ